MAPERWHPDADDVQTVVAWLRGPVAASRPGSWLRPPALRDVLSTHVEDGFVHLTFLDWPLDAARAVADQLLHPDALLVSEPQGFLGTTAPAFEGFGWDGEPPAGVLARHREPPGSSGPAGPPNVRRARRLPGPDEPSAAAVDWRERHLS